MRLQIHGVNQVDPGDGDARAAPTGRRLPRRLLLDDQPRDPRPARREWLPVRAAGDGLRPRRRGADGRPRPHRAGERRAGRRRASSAARTACGSCCRRPRRAARRTIRVHGSAVSSEKPQALLVRQIAERMREVKADGQQDPLGRRAGRRPHRRRPGDGPRWCDAGYVDVLFAGNALATHDIESSLFGTSLGVDLAKGSGVPHGHEHHIRAINTDPRGRLHRRGGGARRADRRRDARDGAGGQAVRAGRARSATTARCPTSTPT